MLKNLNLRRIILSLSLLLVWVVVSACATVQANDTSDDHLPTQVAQEATTTPTSDVNDNNNTQVTSTTPPLPTLTAPPLPTETPTLTQTPPPDDEEDRQIIIIEGPVTAISVNIITIYDFDIAIEPTSPVLHIIQIGDVLRISGERQNDDRDDDDERDDDDGNIFINITAITIIFINVDVVIIDGQVWRDPGDCSGIPNWVLPDDAVEYYLRCIQRPNNANTGGGSGNSGNDDNRGGGNGNHNHDDDDDDD